MGRCKNWFYGISGASCIFRASVIYAGKEALQPFSATFPGHVEIFKRAVILNTDFLPLNYHGAFFEKSALSGPILDFFKKMRK